MRERDRLNADLAAERARNAAAMQQCDHLAAEILSLRRRHAQDLEQRTTALEAVRQLTEQLASARATIANMERSWFWRARLLWVRMRTVLSRRRAPQDSN